MLRVAFQLTPADLEEASSRSIGNRILRIVCAVLSGLLGLAIIYGNVLLLGGWDRFWKYQPAALILFAPGTFLLWAGTEFIGLDWLLNRLGGTFAPRDVCFNGDAIVVSSGGKCRTCFCLRNRSLTETANLFVLPLRPEGKFIVPRRAFTPVQESEFRNLQNPPSTNARFLLEFFLTEADVREASRSTWVSSSSGRIVARIICGAGAVFFLLAPSLNLFKDVQGGWPGMWRTNPFGSAFLTALCALGLWVATGLVGLERLLRHLNHYDEQRVYTLSEREIVVQCGNRTQHRRWERMLNFRETKDAFVLQGPFLSCYIIPKSALGSYTEDEFRAFLLSKLPPARGFTFSLQATNC